MNALTLKHLRYLCALAEHKHFGRAAQASFISQPALSIQIKELEEMVDAPLVERSAREIHMTPLGNELVEKAQKILMSVDEIDDLIRASKEEFQGRLRLGMITTIAPYLLPDIVKALNTQFPALNIIPREAITQPLIYELLAHRLDAAIVTLPINNAMLREFALFEEDFVVVRNPSDADKSVPSAAQLREMSLILLEEGHCFRNQTLAFCGISGAIPHDVMEGSSLSTIVQMVSSGMGLTLIPEMAIPFETKSAEVSISRFTSDTPSRSIGLIWRKSNPLDDQLMNIGAVIRSIGQKRLEEIRGSYS